MGLTLLLGGFIGTVLGLTGAGGGILAVPALVFSMGWSMQQAAPVALAAVAASAAIGAVEGLRHKLVRYRAAVLMAAIGMASAPLGVKAAQLLSQQWLTGLFAIVMLIVAYRLFQSARNKQDHSEPIHRHAGNISPLTGRFVWDWPTAVLLASIGAVTGFMTGLLGVGGGFVVVPMLRRFTNVPMHGVVATSLLVTALVGAVSVAVAAMHGVTIPPAVTVPFMAATGAGMLAGRHLSKRLSALHVQYGFAAVLLIVAIGLLAKSLTHL